MPDPKPDPGELPEGGVVIVTTDDAALDAALAELPDGSIDPLPPSQPE